MRIRLQLHRIRDHQTFRHLNDILDETVAHTGGETLSDDDAKNFHLFFIRWKGIIRKDPPLYAEKSADRSLFDVRKLGLKLVGEAETDYRESRHVPFGILFVHFVDVGTFSVNLGETGIV